MRTIERTGQFKRDYKREAKGWHAKLLDQFLYDVLSSLATDQRLPAKNRDHALSGDWADHRDCHLKPDLLLTYRLPDNDTLQLVRMGSHSELGL